MVNILIIIITKIIITNDIVEIVIIMVDIKIIMVIEEEALQDRDQIDEIVMIEKIKMITRERKLKMKVKPL